MHKSFYKAQKRITDMEAGVCSENGAYCLRLENVEGNCEKQVS